MKPDNKKWMIGFMVLIVFALASSLVMAAIDFGEIWHSVWTYPVKLIVNFALIYFIFIIFSQTILERLDAMMGAKGQKADITQGISGFFLYAIGLIIAVISAFALGGQYIWEWMLAAKMLQPIVKFFWDGKAMRWDLLLNALIILLAGAAVKNFMVKPNANAHSKEAGWVTWIIILLIAFFLANNIEQLGEKTGYHGEKHDYYLWKHPWGVKAYYYLLGNENCIVNDDISSLQDQKNEAQTELGKTGVAADPNKGPGLTSQIQNIDTQITNSRTTLQGKIDTLHKQDKKTRAEINQKRFCYTDKSIKAYSEKGEKNTKEDMGISENEVIGYGVLRGDHLFVLIGGTVLMLWVFMRKRKGGEAPIFDKGSKMVYVLAIFIAASSAHSGWTKIQLIDISYWLVLILMYQNSKMKSAGWKFGLYYAIVDSFSMALFNYRPDAAKIFTIIPPYADDFVSTWIRGTIIGFAAQLFSKKEGAFRQAWDSSRNEAKRRGTESWLNMFSKINKGKWNPLRFILGDVEAGENRLRGYYNQMATDVNDLDNMRTELQGLDPAQNGPRIIELQQGRAVQCQRIDIQTPERTTFSEGMPDNRHAAYDYGAGTISIFESANNVWARSNVTVNCIARNKSVLGIEDYLRKAILANNNNNVQQANAILQELGLPLIPAPQNPQPQQGGNNP